MTKLLWVMAAAATVVAACGVGESERTGDAGSARNGSASASSDRSEVRMADADSDGKVTRREARADSKLAAAFDRYDANGDDALDRAEFARLEAESGKSQKQAEDHEQPGRAMRPRDEFSPTY